MELLNQLKDYESNIIQWRRELHQIPEVGLELPNTAAYVSGELDKLGIPHQKNIGVSGIVGLIEGKKTGKTIALRADMDALAIQEETGLPFASTNGNMHACGHDAHTAMLLGAAKVLMENKEQLNGNVKLFFQAAEEGPGGAKPMIDDGALENPKVDAVLGLHVGVISTEMKNGMVGLCYGNLMACLDRFTLKLIGKGCHGAYPENGVDPIVMAAQIVSGLQTLVSREVKPTEPAVVTVGQIHGGRAYNIIPDVVELEGTVRATNQSVREHLASRMKEMVESIAAGMRGKAEFEYIFGYPPLVNDPDFTSDFAETAKNIVGEKNILEIKTPVMGGEDMAYFLEAVPGTFFFLGSEKETDGVVHPHHNSRFDLDENVFVSGSALLAQGAFDWLEKTSK